MSPSRTFLLSGALLLVLQMGLPPAARAVIGTLDSVPAATLLVPWFEEDLSNVQGMSTLVIVSSATPAATLAKVTLWTDAGVPTFAFHLYLTGYDAQSFRLRDVFDGLQVVTAPAGLDPADTISPQGDLSQDIGIASCTAADFALGATPGTIPPAVVASLRLQHTGERDPVTNLCSGARYGDGIARGYVTVDVVHTCSPLRPDQAGYFGAGGTGIASNANVLIGEVRYVHPSQNFAWGDVAVHLEADATDPATSSAGQYTFYGRLVDWSADDNREPLATRWAVPYPNVEDMSFTVWRDPKVRVVPFGCNGQLPDARPGTWYAFDMAESALDISAIVPSTINAQRIDAGEPGRLPLPFRAGWLDVDLSDPTHLGGPPGDPTLTQGHISLVSTLDVCGGEGRFVGGYQAAALDNASSPEPIFAIGIPVVLP